MDKIMFDENYGLESASIEGWKQRTRRIPKLSAEDKDYLDTAFIFDWSMRKQKILKRYAKYKVGDVVAIAQSYGSIIRSMKSDDCVSPRYSAFLSQNPHLQEEKGWENKMFVRADLMPYRIRITDVWLEHLRDITDSECLKEGIKMDLDTASMCSMYFFKGCKSAEIYTNPRSAYAALINKMCGKNTWEENPYVIVYAYKRDDLPCYFGSTCIHVHKGECLKVHGSPCDRMPETWKEKG